MKKIIAIVLVLALVLSITACGSDVSEPTATETPVVTAAPATTSPTVAPATEAPQTEAPVVTTGVWVSLNPTSSKSSSSSSTTEQADEWDGVTTLSDGANVTVALDDISEATTLTTYANAEVKLTGETTTAITVDASNSTVEVASGANITTLTATTADTSLHIYGYVAELIVKGGRVVIEETGHVATLIIEETATTKNVEIKGIVDVITIKSAVELTIAETAKTSSSNENNTIAVTVESTAAGTVVDASSTGSAISVVPNAAVSIVPSTDSEKTVDVASAGSANVTVVGATDNVTVAGSSDGDLTSVDATSNTTGKETVTTEEGLKAALAQPSITEITLGDGITDSLGITSALSLVNKTLVLNGKTIIFETNGSLSNKGTIEVSTASELIDTLEDIGGTVEMQNDITVTQSELTVTTNSYSSIAISKAATLDLNGYTFTADTTTNATDSTATTFKILPTADLTIKNGTVTATAIGNIDAASIISYQAASAAYPNDLTVTFENVKMTSAGLPLFPRGDAAVANIINSDITVPKYVVATNANSESYYGVTINVFGSNLTTTEDSYDEGGTPILYNVSGSLTVKDTILNTNHIGIVVRGGTATIDDVVINFTGTFDATNDSAYKDDGTNVPRAGIFIGNQATNTSSYQYESDVTIGNLEINGITRVMYVEGMPAFAANVTFTEDFTIDATEYIEMVANATMTIADGATFTNNGTVDFQGAVIDGSDIKSSLFISNGGTFVNNGVLDAYMGNFRIYGELENEGTINFEGTGLEGVGYIVNDGTINLKAIIVDGEYVASSYFASNGTFEDNGTVNVDEYSGLGIAVVGQDAFDSAVSKYSGIKGMLSMVMLQSGYMGADEDGYQIFFNDNGESVEYTDSAIFGIINVTITKDLTIPAGVGLTTFGNLTIESGATLTIEDGAEVYAEGDFINYGTCVADVSEDYAKFTSNFATNVYNKYELKNFQYFADGGTNTTYTASESADAYIGSKYSSNGTADNAVSYALEDIYYPIGNIGDQSISTIEINGTEYDMIMCDASIGQAVNIADPYVKIIDNELWISIYALGAEMNGGSVVIKAGTSVFNLALMENYTDLVLNASSITDSSGYADDIETKLQADGTYKVTISGTTTDTTYPSYLYVIISDANNTKYVDNTAGKYIVFRKRTYSGGTFNLGVDVSSSNSSYTYSLYPFTGPISTTFEDYYLAEYTLYVVGYGSVTFDVYLTVTE
ncbi:MAG: hypothetical protein R3Y32_02100 [Bacillota bacterium]